MKTVSKGNKERGSNMASLKQLANEMEKLKYQIDTMMSITWYQDYEDLSALEDFKEIKNADDRQQLQAYRDIMYRLDEIQSILAYFERPVREVSRLQKNEQGRYETEKGHEYTNSSCIEFLKVEKSYDYDNEKWSDIWTWTTSFVEHNGKDYYIIGHPNVELPGLEVRVRE